MYGSSLLVVKLIHKIAFLGSILMLKILSVIFRDWNGSESFTKYIAVFTRIFSFNPRGVGKKRERSSGEFTFQIFYIIVFAFIEDI